MYLTLPPLSFDDNKLLKSQLDMLIYVQVCRTIDKKLYQDIGSGRTKRAIESTKEAYVARHSLKTTRV